MSNFRNVAELEKLLTDFRARLSHFDSPGYLAGWLAARGVLVPSALTPDQCNGLANYFPTQEAGLALRDELERIAKGES